METHKYLLGVFKKISGLEKRSLASKYLHFHLPDLFFIYDSRASHALEMISKKIKKYKNSTKVDKVYAEFFYHAFTTRAEIEKKLKEKMTPRHFDNMLIIMENKRLIKVYNTKSRHRRNSKK